MVEQKIIFPKDESKHATTTEWWYLNGHLQDDSGKSYSYMSTLFRVRFPAVLGGPFKYLPSTDKYFHHSILTGVDSGKYIARVKIAHASDNSFDNSKLDVSWTTDEDNFKYSLSRKSEALYEATSPDFEIELSPNKKPLLVGESGFVDNVGEETYYYSLSSLKTKGSISLDGEKISVQGKSWMDHQWGAFGAPKGYWNWFSVQLDTGVELVCYESGGKKGRKILATISYADGEQQTFNELSIRPDKEVWISPKTKAKYPLNWTIAIPEVEMTLEVEALVPDHEMNFWYINYWEGPSKITGSIGREKVSGKGFIELVGRHSKVRRYGPLASFFLGQLEKDKYLK